MDNRPPIPWDNANIIHGFLASPLMQVLKCDILHAPTNCMVPSKCWKLVVKSARNLFLYLFFSVERDFFKCFSSSSKLLNTVLATNVFLANFHNRSIIFKFGVREPPVWFLRKNCYNSRSSRTIGREKPCQQ